MALKIHFISGLPRSGSTLLAAILRQNPAFRASMSTPLSAMFTGLLQRMNFRDARGTCCVRSPAWILESVEQLVARHPFRISKMFDPRGGANIYQRVEAMMMK